MPFNTVALVNSVSDNSISTAELKPPSLIFQGSPLISTDVSSGASGI